MSFQSDECFYSNYFDTSLVKNLNVIKTIVFRRVPFPYLVYLTTSWLGNAYWNFCSCTWVWVFKRTLEAAAMLDLPFLIADDKRIHDISFIYCKKLTRSKNKGISWKMWSMRFNFNYINKYQLLGSKTVFNLICWLFQ